MSDDASNPIPRHADGTFAKGGPGRPPGARNRASQRLILAILKDFELNKEQVFYRLRAANVASYVSLVRAILPNRPDVEAADRDGEFEDIHLSGPLATDDRDWREREREAAAQAVRDVMRRENLMFQPLIEERNARLGGARRDAK